MFQEKAIEVATLLGDSVVDVKHCMNPQSGKITPRTWAMLAAGGVCLLMSAIAFVVSVKTAAYNQAGLDYWTRVAHKPAHAYRPMLLSSGYDWLAFGGFAIGIVTMVGALFRVRREKQNPYYRVGTAPDVNQAVEGAPAPSFPLVAPKGDDFVFNFGMGMSGDMIVDGRTVPLAELARSAQPSVAAVGAFELPIPAQAKIRANIGKTSFIVSAVEKPREQTSPLLASLESRTLAYFAGSLGAHLGLVMLLSLMPQDAGTATLDISELEMTDIRGANSQNEDVTPEQEDRDDNGGAGAEASARSMALDEGQAGTLKSNRADGHMRIKKNTDQDQLTAQQAMEQSRSAGILGSESFQNGSLFASLTESGNVSSGPDSTDVWGPIYGAEGEGYGTFGYGRKGFGAGGGCTQEPCGIIGTPTGYGKIGTGRFGQSGWDGPGGGPPGMKRHVAAVPRPTIGQPTGTGDLDKGIIRRYIKRNVDKIAYCYEKQLLANPGMEGTVTISFFISPSGSVTSATGGGFNATVANCVADVIHTIEFPRPQGGGGVTVNYPFTFHAAGN